jgi:hypothetical protein
MKPISMIVGVCIIIVLLGAVLAGITSFRSAQYIEPHNVTTGPGVTTTSLALVKPLFDDDLGYVTITSNDTGDAAIPALYTSATETLNISGLLDSTSRQLSIIYRYNQLTSYIGSDIMAKMWPLLIGLGIFGVIGAAIYNSYSNKRGEE